MIDASTLAAESQLGSLNIDKTERRMVSKSKSNKYSVSFYRTEKNTNQLIVQVTNARILVHNRIDQRLAHEANAKESKSNQTQEDQLTIDIQTSPFFSIFGCQISEINFYRTNKNA